ncbi:hypothetical protein SAMN04489760_12521 [Syntrophus gentianae]|uniref:Uncharacterized protein n=1 Tax=Syntrophus gentianae TaxID=43775 RepID=A0A1H7ZQB1_9BACT|nr:hypothetical protein [Syntrophus gentianae]SEM59669.1 hypothetical protein SAMN04489760_12521 [Syntrophus gentianae]
MNEYLNSLNFPCPSGEEEKRLAEQLESVLAEDYQGNMFRMLGKYQRILSDNRQLNLWEGIFEKLSILFMCGRNAVLDGPMIGVSLAIRDSDYFRSTARLFGRDRSAIAALEMMATCWNETFANTGIWMGKTFEPVSREVAASRTENDPETLKQYSPSTTRGGRNFFRHPPDANLLQSLGLPVLTNLWRLISRPLDCAAAGFLGELLPENLEKEKNIPYTMTGGLFLAQPGISVVPEMKGKGVYQLNYRWPALEPVYPMTRLVDELVQIADGVYLGQLVMATCHYSLGAFRATVPGLTQSRWEIGEPYSPGQATVDYGYQNNGFFLMIDPLFARAAYDDEAFPDLRPRSGESGYRELGYDQPSTGSSTVVLSGIRRVRAESPESPEEILNWQGNDALRRKFTTFCLEPSPREDGDVRELLRDGESILQMLARIQKEIAAQSRLDDSLRHFESLNRLFRSGIAPGVSKGMFQGQGKGFNVRFDAPERRLWYGQEEPCRGFDYYHGATLNLHLGFGDTLRQGIEEKLESSSIFPSGLACLLANDLRGPNVLDAVWASIGRFIFPWAGKSFERISGRKLSMLLDESSDLADRYPERVAELRNHPASWPHYDLVKKNRDRFWTEEGPYARYLRSGSWDSGMTEEDKAIWNREAEDSWVFGNNIQDSRILAADEGMRMLDMNYSPPIPSIQQLADAGPSPFVRQGYIFLGVADRESILPTNNHRGIKKRVFQFHYRYPMIGGPTPIGFCLDELVEIAEGLFLGQLIYATVLQKPFHSSVDPAEYKYQLFGYFLLLDNAWERHRQAIGFDINRP